MRGADATVAEINWDLYGAARIWRTRMTMSDSWRVLARTLIGEPQFTPLEVVQEAGVDIEQARRLWRALGFPRVPDEDRVFTRSDVAMLRAVQALVEQKIAAPDVVVQLARVIGQAQARVAEAQLAASADQFDLLRSARGPDGDAGDAIVSRIESLVPNFEPFLGYVWRRHLLAAVLRLMATSGNQSAAVPMLSVGFADLVGFTALSQQLSDRDLAATVDSFEALSYEHIVERGGRVVKMIGDEVMFTVEDPLVAAETALGLVEACASHHGLPPIRVGLASGSAVSWEGDLFGPTVNLASRLVNLARPSTVMVSDDLGKQLRANPSLMLRHLRPLGLKGIGRVRVWVVRRRAA